MLRSVYSVKGAFTKTLFALLDSTNKRNYDVTLSSVLRHNFALSALFLPR